MERNEPCWCGSGKKWKNCHRNRHLQKKVPIGKLQHKILLNQKHGVCLHPEASKDTCSNKIIKAHTVQRSGGLREIAENGHVLSEKKAFENRLKNKGEISPKPLGIGEASTFMGFCSAHDNSLFEPIESNSFALNHQAAFLLSFRAIAYEYLTKKNSIQSVEIQRELDKGETFQRQVYIQEQLHAYLAGTLLGMQDLKKWKNEYDQKYIEQNYSLMSHYAIEFDEALPLVCSGGFHPEVDFNGNQLQRIGHSDANFEHICINISAIGNKSFLVFGWHGTEDGPAEQFVKSFKTINNSEKANAALILAVEQIENTYFRPSWWHNLSPKDKRHLVNRMNSGIGDNAIRPTSTYINIKNILHAINVSSEIGSI